jgi:hypothetical protein
MFHREKVLAYRLAVFVGVAALLGPTACGQKYEGPKRYPLKGAVPYGGEAVGRGTITFLLIGHEGHKASVLIENGTYSVTEEMGPNAAKYRVEILWQKPTGRKKGAKDEPAEEETVQMIPAKYNQQSTLEIEVGDGKSEHDFNLEK